MYRNWVKGWHFSGNTEMMPCKNVKYASLSHLLSGHEMVVRELVV